MKKRDELSKLGATELRERAEKLRGDLFTLRMDLAVNKLKNHRSIRNTRRELAMVYTCLNKISKPAGAGRKG